MSKQAKQVKKTSFYFHRDENSYRRSSLELHAFRSPYVIDSRKYRDVKSDVKTEIQIYGKLLPKTMERPPLPRPYSTLGSKEWNRNRGRNTYEF